jgi:hypothetical protein
VGFFYRYEYLLGNFFFKNIIAAGYKTAGINYVEGFSVPVGNAVLPVAGYPLTSSTMALRCSSSRLKRVLLPTLGLPTMATV